MLILYRSKAIAQRFRIDAVQQRTSAVSHTLHNTNSLHFSAHGGRRLPSQHHASRGQPGIQHPREQRHQERPGTLYLTRSNGDSLICGLLAISPSHRHHHLQRHHQPQQHQPKRWTPKVHARAPGPPLHTGNTEGRADARRNTRTPF